MRPGLAKVGLVLALTACLAACGNAATAAPGAARTRIVSSIRSSGGTGPITRAPGIGARSLPLSWTRGSFAGKALPPSWRRGPPEDSVPTRVRRVRARQRG